MNKSPKSNEIHIVRTYEAPLRAVWNAWTDPSETAQWWGPRGFTVTNHSKDLRPGGHWHYTMHGPDGVDYPNRTHYFEVEEGKRLVYDHGGYEDRPPLFRVTVLFSESNGLTTMDMTMALPTPAAAEETRAFIKKAGGNATWDRLAEYLAKSLTGKELFVINRSFDVRREKMFEVWTSPKHLTLWLSPTGTTMKFFRADIQPGGSAFYMMAGTGDFKLYGKTKYLQLEGPSRLVYSQQFCDEQENVARHPMAPTWPETMITVVTFAEEAAGKTRVTVTWQPDVTATANEVAAFVKERPGMTQGWTGSFDKLEEYLETL